MPAFNAARTLRATVAGLPQECREVIAWCMANGREVAEVPAECRYTPEASSVDFGESVRYGLATLDVLARYLGGGYRKK